MWGFFGVKDFGESGDVVVVMWIDLLLFLGMLWVLVMWIGVYVVICFVSLRVRCERNGCTVFIVGCYD